MLLMIDVDKAIWDLFEQTHSAEVRIETDLAGLRLMKDFFGGWVGVPTSTMGQVRAVGVHPTTGQRMEIVTKTDIPEGTFYVFQSTGTHRQVPT